MAKDNAQCTIHNAQRRYIDVDKFAEKICDFQQIDEDNANKMIFLLRTFPTANVAEVKHGEWKDRYNNKYANQLYECSVCGGRALYEFYKNDLMQWEKRQALTPVCPHCGAKMDLSEKVTGCGRKGAE